MESHRTHSHPNHEHQHNLTSLHSNCNYYSTDKLKQTKFHKHKRKPRPESAIGSDRVFADYKALRGIPGNPGK